MTAAIPALAPRIQIEEDLEGVRYHQLGEPPAFIA